MAERRVEAADWDALTEHLRPRVAEARLRPRPRAALRYMAWEWCQTHGVAYQSLHRHIDTVFTGLLAAPQQTD